jgi:hypothetical protein
MRAQMPRMHVPNIVVDSSELITKDGESVRSSQDRLPGKYTPRCLLCSFCCNWNSQESRRATNSTAMCCLGGDAPAPTSRRLHGTGSRDSVIRLNPTLPSEQADAADTPSRCAAARQFAVQSSGNCIVGLRVLAGWLYIALAENSCLDIRLRRNAALATEERRGSEEQCSDGLG